MDEPVGEPTTIRVYTGADGEFALYEDDGTSLDYLSGESRWTRFTWDDGTRQLRIEPGPGSESAPPRSFRVELMPEGRVVEVEYVGAGVDVRP